MEEYFRQNYFFILNEGVIILAAIIGIFCLKKYRKSHVKYFIYFLVYVVLVELIGYYPTLLAHYKSLSWIRILAEGTIFERNYLWYALFWQIGSALFLSFYFTINSLNKRYKNIIKYSTMIYLILTVICFMFYYQNYYDDEVKSIWFLSVLQAIICVVCYFIEILNSERLVTFYRSVDFYVAAVFFIWFLIRTPLIFYQIYYSKADWSFVFFRRDIILFANMFMYLTFTFALIYCKPTYDQ